MIPREAHHAFGQDERSFAAAQQFLLAAKTFWTTRMYPELRAEYEACRDSEPQTPERVAHLLAESTLYHYFAWLERHLQKMKYSGRYGLVNWHARDRAAIEAALEVSGAAAALDPALEMPRYTRGVDIHQHPGGLWSDPIAGVVYERGARSTTPLAGPKHADLHQRFTEQIALLCQPVAILDMGCGFGKSTLPFARAFAGAQVEAVDLAAPCLKLAAGMAAQAGLRNVRYAQCDASATRFGEGSFDLVTSTMLLHELPPPMVDKLLRESARVLRAGGWVAHLDFLPQVQARGDAFAQFIHDGHGRRNNEPFMAPLAKMDLRSLLASLGFTDIQILPFAEFDGALDPAYPHWRFPWAMIQARKGA